jgi:hypothetical protein
MEIDESLAKNVGSKYNGKPSSKNAILKLDVLDRKVQVPQLKKLLTSCTMQIIINAVFMAS